MEYIKDQKPISEEMLNNTISYLWGIHIDKETIKVLSAFNGGYIINKCIKIDGEIFGIGEFLDFRLGESSQMSVRKIYIRNKPFLPISFYPFAVDSSGNYYGFFLNNIGMAEIAFWNHEWEFLNDNSGFEPKIIANSLSSLLDQLKPCDELEEIDWEKYGL